MRQKQNPHKHNYSREMGIKRMDIQLVCQPNIFGIDIANKVSNTTKNTSAFKDCGYLDQENGRTVRLCPFL